LPFNSINQAASVLEKARLSGKNLYSFGNGGSAATALHIANDLSGITVRKGPRFKIQCLSCNISTITAIANDYSYDAIFAHQLGNFIVPGDVVICMSASGNSPNCINALTLAKELGGITIGMTGFDGGRMRSLCDVSIHVPINSYYIVETAHLAVSHAISFILSPL